MKDPELRDDPPASSAVRPAADATRRRSSRSATRGTRPTPARRSPRCARRWATPSWSARCTCRARGGSPTSTTSTRYSRSSCCSPRGTPRAACRHRGVRQRPGGRLGHVEPRLRPARHALRARERPGGGHDAAHPAGPGVPLPGRRDRPGRRAARRVAVRPRRAATASATRCSGTRSPSGGFSTGEAWLRRSTRPSATSRRSATTRTRRLTLTRELIALRRELGDGFELLDAADGRGRLPPRRPHGRGQHHGRAAPPAAPAATRGSRRRPGRCATANSLRTQARSQWIEPSHRGVRARVGGGELARTTPSRRIAHSRRASHWGPVASAVTRAAAAPARSTGTPSTSPAAPTRWPWTNCNKEANGRYTINYVKLPNIADQQRELLVRRLAAEDDDIDLMSLDVIWTAEFAQAEWILPWEGERRSAAEEDKLEGPLETVRVRGPDLGHPVTRATPSCSGTARTAWTRRRRTSPGTR